MASPTPRSPARARPLRMRLLLLAASGLLPLVMVLVWGLNHLLEERRSAAQVSVMELSRALSTAVDAELRSVMTLLQHMSNSDQLERAELHDFQEAAERTATQLGWNYIALADFEGRVLLRTNQPFGKASLAVIEPESMARVVETHRPVVSRVIEWPKAPSTAFIVRVPVLRGDQLVYVLSASLPTDKILAVLQLQNIPSGPVLAVFDQTSRRVARTPPSTTTRPSPSLQALLDRKEAHGSGRTTTLEGVDSHTGYTRVLSSDWVVAVGTSVESANVTLRALLQAVAVGLAASLALAIALAWVLSRRVLAPIEALKNAAAALGRGAPVHLPPLDIEELDDVAHALTSAAADRDRAAARIGEALRTAEDANRSKDQFLAMLGHELRNPLAPIATAVQLMALKGDEKTAQERRIIERQLFHVTRLVDDLLDVSRITSGRLAIRREPVPLAQVLTQVVDAIQQSAYQHRLSLEMATGMDQAWVAGDEVRLVQVFNNLLVNAIKFTPAGGAINVRACMEGDHVRVEVQDSGVGITRSELERIFDLFYQAPQSSDRARGGLGLGLAIVKSLVHMHGGSVSASSDGPGHGTCVSVTLPLCEAPAHSILPGETEAARGAANILVVDDNEDAADTCATLLELHGYEARVAYTPQAALEMLEDFAPDLAILDIGLPGMSGYTLAGRMKAPPYNYGGRLVALTGYGQAADMAASKAAGFDAHLTKPVSPGDLLDLVARFTQEAATSLSSSAGNPS